jgi:hypothetical protein
MTGDLESLQLNLKSLSQLTDLELTEIAGHKHCRVQTRPYGSWQAAARNSPSYPPQLLKQRVQPGFAQFQPGFKCRDFCEVASVLPSQAGNLSCLAVFLLPDALAAK